jgi:hypothetical protein
MVGMSSGPDTVTLPLRAPAATPRRGGRAGRAATLLSTASDEAATSLLPALLAGTLGASPIALGVVEGLASAADGVARLGGGALSADPHRRRWISAGSYTVMAALTGLIAVAASSVQVGLLRAGAAGARGLRSPQRYASVPERVGSPATGARSGSSGRCTTWSPWAAPRWGSSRSRRSGCGRRCWCRWSPRSPRS